MIRAINPEATAEYVCEADRESPEPTVFIIGTIDARLRSHINDRASSFDGDGRSGKEPVEQLIRGGSWRWMTCKYGIRGWRNLADHAGNQIAERFDTFPYGGKSYRVVSDVVLTILPEDVLMELTTEISKMNTLQEAEKRPLASPSS